MARTIDPFRSMERLMQEAARTTVLAMPMDVYRDGEQYLIRIDLPGVDPSTIDVDVEDRTMTIRAARPAESTGDGVEWLTRERPTGTFARQLTLGNGLAIDRIDAQYLDGVLEVTVPVAEEAKPRRISVQHAQRPKTITADTGGARGTHETGKTDKSDKTDKTEKAGKSDKGSKSGAADASSGT